MTKVTIAIPFYNSERFLEAAIVSVIDQTHKDWKLLLVDDGSTDTSVEIAKKYVRLDKRISLVADGKNRNLAYRLNQITSLTDTEYLARMDADDVMHPRRIAEQLQVLNVDSTIDVLGTNAFSINEYDEVVGIRLKFEDETRLISVSQFIHPTIIARRSWFQEHPYDPKFARMQDAELWHRSISSSNFKVITEPLFFYREISNTYYKKYWRALPTLYKLAFRDNFSSFWFFRLITNFLKVFGYFVYEKILKSDFLIRRRNKVIFKNVESMRSFIKK